MQNDHRSKGLVVRFIMVTGWAIAVYLIQVVGHLTLWAFFTQYTDQCSRYKVRHWLERMI